MRLRTLTLFLWSFLIATAAIAGEEHRMKIEIVTDDGDAQAGARVVRKKIDATN